VNGTILSNIVFNIGVRIGFWLKSAVAGMVYFSDVKQFATLHDEKLLTELRKYTRDKQLLPELVAISLVYIVFIYPLWCNTEHMKYGEFVKFLATFESDLKGLSEEPEESDLLRSTKNYDKMVKLGTDKCKEHKMTKLFKIALAFAGSDKTTIGTLICKHAKLVHNRVIIINKELLNHALFCQDVQFSITNSPNEVNILFWIITVHKNITKYFSLSLH